jgi:hypothetical protein
MTCSDRALALAAALAALAVLVACVPVAREEPARPVVVLATGPTQRPLDGLDAAARAALRAAGFDGSFGPRITTSIARYRDMSERRAVRTTAELARIGGGDLGLYVGVVQLERDVRLEDLRRVRLVRVDLQLQVTLVDPASGATVWSTRDVVRTAVRRERSDEALPPLRADPTALALRDDALRALAPSVVTRIEQADVHP